MWSFESNHCGIETVIKKQNGPISFALNRTIVGLKQLYQHGGGLRQVALNRTIVGLKHNSNRDVDNFLSHFESNHCGIETIILGDYKSKKLFFESNHCGIETTNHDA